MHSRVLVLGAGFGGLETAARLSELLGEEADVTIIDASPGFVFGYHKLDVLFGQSSAETVRMPYQRHALPGVRFVNEKILAIDPESRSATTAGGSYSGDVLVVALGADYDVAATPGLAELGEDFYSVAGTVAAADALSNFAGGDVVVGVCGSSFKCPPAPHETALRLHDFLVAKGVRDASTITVVVPLPVALPPAPELTAAIDDRYAERGITFIGSHVVSALEENAEGRVAVLNDGQELPVDLFLGVPVHVAPPVVVEAGLVEDGWIPVDRGTAATKFPGVYAVGDVTSIGTAKAGVFSEGTGRVVADRLVAALRGEEPTPEYDGRAWCLVELGEDEVAGVDIDFFREGGARGFYTPPEDVEPGAKDEFAASRHARWF